MTVFVDTSVWFAAVFAKDTHHASARRILSDEPSLTTTDHIIVETWLLLKNRFNQTAAEAFFQRVIGGWCRIEIATAEDLQSAEMIRVAFIDQRFSWIARVSSSWSGLRSPAPHLSMMISSSIASVQTAGTPSRF